LFLVEAPNDLVRYRDGALTHQGAKMSLVKTFADSRNTTKIAAISFILAKLTSVFVVFSVFAMKELFVISMGVYTLFVSLAIILPIWEMYTGKTEKSVFVPAGHDHEGRVLYRRT